jgi:hypothetical protein
MQASPVWNVERSRPGCYIFLLDQSNSMDDPIAGNGPPKKVVLANGVNYFLNELITHCEKGDALPRNYYDVALIGYTTDERGNPEVGTAFQGALAGADGVGFDIVSIVDIFQNQLGTTEVNGETISYWYEPVAKVGTPMAAGLHYCRDLAEMWANGHPDSVPPIVVHITDGEPSDPQNDPEAAARAVQAVRTKVGNALLFNIHLSEKDASPSIFPASEAELPDHFAQMLFRMSSALPDFCMVMARNLGWQVNAGARGMAFNTDATVLANLLSVGTIPERRGLR